jgi:hypothetical protein
VYCPLSARPEDHQRVTDAPFLIPHPQWKTTPISQRFRGAVNPLARGGTVTAWGRTSSVAAPPCPGPRRRRVFAAGAYRGCCCAHRSLNRQDTPMRTTPPPVSVCLEDDRVPKVFAYEKCEENMKNRTANDGVRYHPPTPETCREPAPTALTVIAPPASGRLPPASAWRHPSAGRPGGRGWAASAVPWSADTPSCRSLGGSPDARVAAHDVTSAGSSWPPA